jgi:16S rRNA (cytidine1402-2'-O)-methyltransferase
MSTLYIIATPIGNLEDITFRALRILREVDLILCEDTRVTKKLLDYYQIEKPLLSYHQHSKLQKINYILDLLEKDNNLALVSDAGTPGISDPGNLLIEEIVEKLGEKVKIIPVAGSSAVTAAASISGFPMDRFLFLGFPPAKRKRQKFFKEVIESKYPVIFYESPYRIIKTLNELKLATGNEQQETRIVVARELTKKFETVYRGKIEEVLKKIEKDKILGEFVVVVNSRIPTNLSTN